jgi:hypothetical protein
MPSPLPLPTRGAVLWRAAACPLGTASDDELERGEELDHTPPR